VAQWAIPLAVVSALMYLKRKKKAINWSSVEKKRKKN
jgi:hypothetical protein